MTTETKTDKTATKDEAETAADETQLSKGADENQLSKGADENQLSKGTDENQLSKGEAQDTDTPDTDAQGADAQDVDADDEALDDENDEARLGAAKPHGVGQGAAAVVAAGLGVVSLTGSWVGTIAAARSNLVGQLETAQTAGVAKQLEALYGNQWQLTALIAGAFALLAVIIGAAVLARPAFGTPGRVQAPWIKSVAWAGFGLGAIGLVLAVAKYTDVMLALPSAP
ncbi:hypothetical protein ACFQVC_40055 [Streptomyces monticola]|uniref:Integral membrane protein n=1 Tax=Streptomyces monticola TaxID=2666263 RepID=A0ABW2JWK1_9ACTN